MAGRSGRRAVVKVTGAPVVFANAACTDSGDHQTYQITDPTKRVWDRGTAVVVKVAGVVTVEVFTFNRLTGTIRFAAVNAGRGAVTVTGASLPLASAAGAFNFTYSLTLQALDDTDFDEAFIGFKHYQPGALDVEGSIGRRVSIDTGFHDLLVSGAPVVIQFFSDRNSPPDFSCWAILSKDSVSAAQNAIQDGSIDFKGAPDDQGVAVG